MIKGLFYTPNIITNIEAEKIIEIIDVSSWSNDLSRRVQHYGYKYDYKKRKIDNTMKIGNLPEWCKFVIEKIDKLQVCTTNFDQLIINEYKPGQGIAYHIDCEPCFGDIIVSISLGSDCCMGFIHKSTKEKKELLLEKNSLLILSGDARYDWLHGIQARKKDNYNGKEIIRERRVSLTFRSVIL